MCAPTKDIAKIAIAGAAIYATGGAALSAMTTTAGGSLATAATTASTTSSLFSTLANFAKVAAPIVGTAGSIYQGYLTKQMLESKANFVDFSITQDIEASALRKAKRQRDMRRLIDAQKAKYTQAGIVLEGTPVDILGETSAKFAEEQFIDDFNTAQGMYSKQISAEQLRTEAQAAQLGGFINAATVLSNRGFVPQKKPVKQNNNLLDMGVAVGDM
jgi:hypothetical protein